MRLKDLRSFFLILIITILFSCSIILPAYAAPEDDENGDEELSEEELIDQQPVFNESNLDAEAVMLVDAKTGLVLYENNVETQIYPASTTKIMTCLIALEETEMSDLITCGQEVVFPPEYSVMGVNPGEIVTARDLIYGMMLMSGNDAAMALAVYIGGSVEGFATLMNAKAEELGMTNTHFANPHGGHDDTHYTTAEDMAKLAMAAYQDPDFMEIVGTRVYQPEDTNMEVEKGLIDSTNRLIRSDIASYSRWYYEYATGMKTGHTSQAGYCLVASSSKETQDLIALIFNHESDAERFTLAKELFEFGYENFDYVDLSDLLGDSVIREAISNARADDANGGYMEFIPNISEGTYFSDTNNFIAALKTHTDEINVMVDLNSDLRAPIYKGEVYGKVIYQYRDRLLLRSELVASYDMLEYATDYLTFQEESPDLSVEAPKDLSQGMTPVWWWMIFPSLLIVLIIFKMMTYQRSKYKKYNKGHNYPAKH